jgi:thiamine pyrophosphate-dependent acetolactate synthase large subunit-like protein
MKTVRDKTIDVLRHRDLMTIFSNPGSTEIPFLQDLPEDFTFVLGLHEGSVVGMATGWAIARDAPAMVLIHTTAGLGNAVGALATARVNRAPLVVIVGQQDRRHLALEPFLAGHKLELLAGEYPVWTIEPVRATDVPGAVSRAYHEAIFGRGPAIVIVPMDDWDADADSPGPLATSDRIFTAVDAPVKAITELAALLNNAESPVLIVGAGGDDEATWDAIVPLAERLACPVWQEAFGARAGFPQNHPRFAGHLPAGRGALLASLAGHDVLLAIGAPIFRQYGFESGPLFADGAVVALITPFAEEAHHSPANLSIVASLSSVCDALVPLLQRRDSPAIFFSPPPDPPPPEPGQSLTPSHVFAALASRLEPDTVVFEESPSSRSDLQNRLPARQPLGFVSAAMGGLGFALPASIGVKMALPERPVVALLGDGSSLYSIQALWSASNYAVGILAVILKNGGYAIMDRLAHTTGSASAWPSFGSIDFCSLASGFSCDAVNIQTIEELAEVLDSVLPDLAFRTSPLVLVIDVAR